MQLVYLTEIFEDNHNPVLDCFKTDSVNIKAILVYDKLLRNLMIWKSVGLMLLVIYDDGSQSS